MQKSKISLSWAFFLVLPALALAQTKLDLPTQSKRVDFSSAQFTRPVKLGTSTPATCVLGDLFFKADAIPGANLMACVGTNSWEVLGSSLPAQTLAFDNVLSTDGITASWSALGGDVSGSPASLTVSKLLNRPLASTVPTTGYSLVWNGTAWEALPSPNGSIGIALEGTLLATRGRLNLIPGPGLLTALTDTGTQINLQQSLDTAVVLTRDEFRRANGLACNSAGADAAAYTCVLAKPLTAYAAGTLLYWVPDVNGTGGATTLAIDGLAPKPVVLADGATNPRVFDLVAGQVYPIWDDGTSFRLIHIRPGNQTIAASRPTCDATQRGRFWVSLGATDVKDEVAVCAKGATGNPYAWRVLY